ncbi:acyltransferase family protein [Corynebacterium sp.]|uniref:acyltransferase family protein n=1 Tax=Corynebacterium sp. TaxID=1720 RepID=UPI0026DA8BA9|nr:acyltransferase family protein [Corynebacterium sp.]MDO5031371.1 acyltransferase family protein [Corynebacterium sp.]
MSSLSHRLAWPDVAKGISILGVVLLHITLQVPESQETWLAAFNVWLDPLRLPLFFLVSGYFSRKVLKFSFPQLFARRLWYFLVPYVVWMLIEQQLKRVEYHWVFGDPIFDFSQLFGSMLVGHSMAWFLHSLILFNIFLWCVRTLPSWAAFALSFTPVLFMAWQAEYTSIAKAVMFLPVFVGAAFFREWITAFADAIEAPFKGRWDSRSFWAYSGTVAAYAVGFFTRRAWDNYSGEVAVPWPFLGAETLAREDVHILVRTVEQIFETPVGIALAVAISYIPVLSTALRFIGSHTLPIYLGHPLGLTLFYGFYMAKFPHEVTLAGQWPLESTWFWLFMCTIYCAIASLALWYIQKIPVLKWTMRPPSIVHLCERGSRSPRLVPPSELSPRGSD